MMLAAGFEAASSPTDVMPRALYFWSVEF